MVPSRRRRRYREALWRYDPHCFWCGKLTVLTEATQRNAATLDHLYSQFHPKRNSNGLTDTVLACRACNIQRGDYEAKGAYFMPKRKDRVDIARETSSVTARKTSDCRRIQMTDTHKEEAREIVRVEQRTERDCLRCCLAMVTHIDYDDVPDFVADHGESWPTACEAWLSELGMGLLMMPTAPTYVPPWLPIIARGSTEYSDVHHFVVVTSNAVIDPSPSQHRLKEAAATYAVVNSGSLANEFLSHLAAKYSATCSTLASRDAEVREVLEGLRNSHGCWCPGSEEYEFREPFVCGPDCKRAQALYEKVQPKEKKDGSVS